MGYLDLPPGWVREPITDSERTADVVDLTLDLEDREQGALLFLLLDADGRVLPPPMLIVGVDDPAWVGGTVARLTPAVAAMMQGEPQADGLLFARGRGGRLHLGDADREWHQAATDLARRFSLSLVGAFLATPSGIRAFPAPPGASPLDS